MNQDIIEDLYTCMATERVNIEFMFVEDESIGIIINCRFRPWKGGKDNGLMVLSGGRSLDEALFYAYKGLYERNFIALDWTARTVRIGLADNVADTAQARSATRAPTFDVGASFVSLMGTQSTKPKNGGLRASERRQAETDVKNRDRLPK